MNGKFNHEMKDKNKNNSVSKAPQEKKHGILILSHIYVLNHICGELGFTFEEGYTPARSPTKKG